MNITHSKMENKYKYEVYGGLIYDNLTLKYA